MHISFVYLPRSCGFVHQLQLISAVLYWRNQAGKFERMPAAVRVIAAAFADELVVTVQHFKPKSAFIYHLNFNRIDVGEQCTVTILKP